MEEKNVEYVAPDGGWGWMVCFGGSLINLTLRGLDPSFGLLFGDLLKKLKVDTTGASIIMSCLETMMAMSGMLAAVLIKKYGYRKVAFLGCFLNCFGLMLTSTANSMAHIICTYSIIGGIGTGLGVSATFVAVSCYFRDKRTQAVGFSMAGTSLGMMCMPQIVHLLLSYYDFRGTVLILSAINLNSVVGCCFLEPVKYHLKTIPCRKQELVSNENSPETESHTLLRSKGEPEEIIKLRKISLRSSVPDLSAIELAKHTKNEKFSERDKPRSFSEKMVALFDLQILKDPCFVNIVFGLSLVVAAEMNFKLIMPFFLSNIGMTKAEVAWFLTLIAFADVIARLTLPTVLNRMKLSNRKIVFCSSICVTLIRSTLAEQNPGKIMTGLLFLNGIFRGITLTNINLCVAEHCSLQVLPSALGIFNVWRAVSIAIVGPLLGYVRDASGSYRVSIHGTSATMFVCLIFWGIEMGLKKYRERGSESKHVNKIADLQTSKSN